MHRPSNRSAFTLVELLVVIAVIAVVLGLLLAAVQRVRMTAARLSCQSNLRQVALALHQHHDAVGRFPPGVVVTPVENNYLFLGWTAAILPWLEQDAVWRKVERAFATDPNPAVFYGHPPHAELLATPIKLFNCPADPRLPGPFPAFGIGGVAFTSYLGVEGTDQVQRDGTLYADSRTRLTDITDGTSNTLMVGERPPASNLLLGWWYRGWGQNQDGSAEMLLGAKERNTTELACPEISQGFSPGAFDRPCSRFSFWSPHDGGANFAFADASVRFLSYSAAPLLPALAIRAGGEPFSAPD